MSAGPLPPGSRNALLNPILYLANPYRFYERGFARYGDTFFFTSPNGPVVLTRDPENIKTIYTLDHSQIGIYPGEALDFFTGKNSVLMLTDERHKRERKLLNPPFHGARMRAYGTLMQKSAHDEAKSWRVGEVIDFQRAMQRVSLAIIAQAVFGIADPAEAQRAQDLSARYMESLSPLVLFFPWLRRDLLGLSPWARLGRARRELDEVLYAQIRRSRARPPGNNGEDILSMLLGARYDDGSAMSDEQIRDELLTLLIAGHETTALSLSWLFYHLYRHPETLVRLRRELDALGPDPEPEQIAHCRYLEACCNETLRLYPIVAETFRRLREPLQLGPYTVPAGYAVSVSAIGLHRHPALYPDGEAFRPERFLERKFSPFEFVPFGGGVRRCLGAAFALHEMKLVAHALLNRCELEPANSRPIRPAMRGATFGPKGGVPMRLVALRRQA
jgi:cytochrome P450